MQLPSFNQLASQAGHTLKRFPLALLSSALVALACIILTESSSDVQLNHWAKIGLVSVLGISLFTATALVGEKKEWPLSLKWGVHAIGAALLLFYYIMLPEDATTTAQLHGYRYVLYFIGVHLLVAIGPYWTTNEIDSFWQYNKTLFLRFLTAVLFSGVLFIGLVVALGSLELLFNISIDFESYLELLYIIGGIFNTWFFLAGIPDPIHKLDHIRNYPKGLKVFTQNILIPLVIIYMIILYLYMAKIITQWAWPEGWISILVLSFSIAGILANLLLHPLRNDIKYKWVKRFSKGYYWILVPLSILLLLAIWRRISEYGITVERYFVLVLGLWLTGIVLYFVISRAKNIKVIPASLCIVAFATSIGPWGAFHIAEQSQLNRLQLLLQQNKQAQQKTIAGQTEDIEPDYAADINSTLYYLKNTHGLKEKQVAEALGVDKIESWENPNTHTEDLLYYSFNATDRSSIALEEYEWMMKDIHLYQQGESDTASVDNRMINVYLKSHEVLIISQREGENSDTLHLPLQALRKQLVEEYAENQYNIPANIMIIEAANSQMNAKLYLNNVSWQSEEPPLQLYSIDFDLLLRFSPS